MHTNNIISGTPQAHIPRGPASAAPPGRTSPGPYPPLCRMALRLSGLRGSSRKVLYPEARQAQRRRAGHLRRHTRLCAGWRLRLIRPTGGSRKPLYRRPGKRSAAGQDTADTVPVFVPDGATLIRPTGSSRKLLYRRPGKRSAAGR
ncbi:hypothetical protein IE986_15555 [Klebsiella pneumoniae]|uniref:Uncharacterized protein n=1 Tax=Klebsiella pneumoniae TaxID=573 RepID=A0A927DD16_KLEPN|nr:hypothetical protein [Klebsiella pneumoniae]